MSDSSAGLFAIRRILVEDLFGQFTYDLQLSTTLLTTDSSRLLILYGDNGSGKTTLLKLIFHMLVSEEGRGHKSFLAETRFRTLMVELEDGTSVVAARNNSKLIGQYRFSINKVGNPSAEILFEVDEKNTINLPDESEEYPKYQAVMQSLSELNLSLYFLQDDRKVWSDIVREEEGELFLVSYEEMKTIRTVRQRNRQPKPVLDLAIQRFFSALRNQAFQASNVGDFNVSTIYSEVAKRIASSSVEFTDRHLESFDGLINTLEEQSERSDAFARFGLSSQLSIKELLSVLHAARPETLPILSSVLTPYVTGLKARLDALQSTYSSIKSFVEGINSFYSHKEVEFDLDNGLRIQTSKGEKLNPNSLSSGEQQLLLLFCNALSVHQRATLFLIDEPELSLNVKWQRQLIQALLRSTAGRRIQFLLATHSLELLALHKEHVVKLIDVT